MEENYLVKEKAKKRSRILMLVTSAVIPFPVFFLFRGGMLYYTPERGFDYNNAQAAAFAGGLYLIFIITFFIAASGDIHETFSVMAERVRDLFQDIRGVPERAWEIYRINLKWGGLWYLAYIGLMLYALAWAGVGAALYVKFVL